MAPNELSTDEFVEYAAFLFGAQWRNELPAKLGISRKSLIISLASGEQIPANMTISIVGLLEERLEKMQQEQAVLKDRIRDLQGRPNSGFTSKAQPRGQLQHAC